MAAGHEGERDRLLPSNGSQGYGTDGNAAKKAKSSRKKDDRPPKVSLFKLFRYATGWDKFLIFVGSVFSIINGVGWPLLAIIFGQMTNTFIQQSQSGLVISPESNTSLATTLFTSDLRSSDSPGLTSTSNPLLPSESLTTNSSQTTKAIGSNISAIATEAIAYLVRNATTIAADNYEVAGNESGFPTGTTPEELEEILTTVSSRLLRTLLSVGDAAPSMFNALPPDQFEAMMTTYALYYVYVGIGVFVASFIQVACWEVAAVRQIFKLRQEFFYQLMRQEIGWFDRQQSGELAMKLNDDIERVREGIGDKCAMFIQYASTFVAGFVVGFFVGWELTLVIMAMTPLLALSSAFLGKLLASSAAREQQKYAVAGGIAEEVLSCIRTVVAFNAQGHEIKRYVKALDAAKQIALRKYLFMSLGIAFTFLVLYGTYALAFWYGSLLILDGKLDPGSVFTVFFAVMIGSFSLGNAVPHLTSIATAKGSASLVFEVLDSVPFIDPYSNKGSKPASFKADIEFRNVYFSYPIRKSVEVLKGLNLKIKEGQTVALCGSSGSGKSTIVNLLLRFYDPSSGRITIDGFDLKTLNLSWLRSITGVVSQEPVLFNCTIAENIEYGEKGVSFHDIVRAAKMANAHDFIVALPQGYDTMVGERGSQLSGGQKQRIAIARALVRDPKILLLDEATSALDAESEGIVQEALDKARQGRTTIIVAHRLSTIKDADVIYVMENGRVVEEGNHEELMAREGVYHQLVTNQVFVDESGYSTGEIESPTAIREERENRRRSTSVSGYRRSSAGKQSLYASERDLQRLFSETEEEEAEVPSGWQILKRCSAKEWTYIFYGSLASFIVGGSLPVFAVFYSEMFQTFTLVGNDLKEAAFFWSMMFLVLAAAAFIGNYFRTIEFAKAGETLTMRLRQEAFSNIMRLHIGWFDDESHATGKLTTRLATDVPMVKSATGHRIGTVFTAVITLLTSLVIAFIFGWKLALALVIAVPILLASGAIQMKVQKGNQKRDAELMEDAGNVATEAAENIRTVQALNQEKTFYEEFSINLVQPYMESKRNAFVYALAFGFSQGMIFFIYAAAFRLGAFLVANNQMEAVNVYRVFFAMAFSAVSVGQWSSFLPDYTKARLSAGLVFKLIDTQPEIDSFSKGGVRPDISGEITFSDVHFRYPSRKTVRVLRGFNLNVKPGQTVALIGPSGCGKSTTIQLILRFYDPSRGMVKVDGFDIRTINLQHLRKHIAIVSQEPVLFNCSIRDNITYGLDEPITQEEVEKAARLANAHDFITTLPQGYDTSVGEKGTQLSGGQKQRIAIARALVRDPKILLLDEATSALDTESEKIVQAALDKARQGRTCIIVAHRLSTIQHADCIVVLDQGKVAEQGTHEELLNKKGVYYRLTKKQRIKQ